MRELIVGLVLAVVVLGAAAIRGTPYYVVVDRRPTISRPVHRFWNPQLGHFYTSDETEFAKLRRDYSHVWTYEGIGGNWYPPDANQIEVQP